MKESKSDLIKQEPLAGIRSAAELPVGPMTEQWLNSNLTSVEMKSRWIKDGFAVAKGVFSAEEIERYNKIVAQVRSEVDDGKDEFGFGDRIGQLHQKHPELMNMAANKDVLNFLEWAFNDEPVLFGSLNFEKGTQQDAHIDAIFFWPEPSYSMAGCWVALEDVKQDAGPLFYLPNSHRWPFYLSEDLANEDAELKDLRDKANDLEPGHPERAEIVQKLGLAWTESLHQLESEFEVEPVCLDLKAGDVVFWHSLLAHGGSPTKNRALSRKSAVFHYVGSKTNLYSDEQFMLCDRDKLIDLPAQPKADGDFKGRMKYIRYGYFVTYANGQQIIHEIDT
jgi:ectoine hydroxylase-related dioxygenase (phytanoyl-CoA dioxygenase family)